MRNCNIQHMIIYMESRGSPYSLIGEQRLHNFVSNAVDPEVQAQKLLNFRTIADPAHSSFRQDGLLSKLYLIQFLQMDVSKPIQSTANTVKHLAFAHRCVDPMKERGMPMAEIMTVDVVPFTILIDDMRCHC